MLKNHWKKLLLLIFVFLATPNLSSATSFKNEKNFYLATGESISGNIYLISQKIVINGDVHGDLIALTNEILINGRVEGDVIVATQKFEINGEINGNLRLAATRADVNGKIARNLNFFGNYLSLKHNSKIFGSVLSNANSLELSGTIMKNVDHFNGELMLNGFVQGDVRNNSTNNNLFIIGDPAIVNGDIYYHSDLTLSEKAQVSGSLYFTDKTEKRGGRFLSWWIILVYKILATLLIGITIFKLNKNWLFSSKNNLLEKTRLSIFWGLAFIILIPLISLILLISVIGAPLSLLLIIVWLSMILISQVFASFYIGTEIVKKVSKKHRRKYWPSFLIGASALFLIASLPFIGVLILIAIIIISSGSIIINLRK